MKPRQAPIVAAAIGHAFDHGVRITFENTAIHERARIALVRVADHVLRVARRLARELPLAPGRESGTATSAQSGHPQLVEHRVGVGSLSTFASD